MVCLGFIVQGNQGPRAPSTGVHEVITEYIQPISGQYRGGTRGGQPGKGQLEQGKGGDMGYKQINN